MIVQENHYYPFGLNIVSLEKNGEPNMKFQYNGKEKQEEFGLNWLDYGARMYDAALGRWHKVDPSSEKYYEVSAYAYANNSPMIFIDPDGMDNIIYLVYAGGAKNKKDVHLAEIKAAANMFFMELGIKTRVKIYNGSLDDFDKTKLDKTDGVAVLGGAKEVADFIENKVNKEFGVQLRTEGEDNEGNLVRAWVDPKNEENIELSTNYGEKYELLQNKRPVNTIAIDFDRADTYKSSGFRVANASNPLGTAVGISRAVGFVIAHGAGHNSGMAHYPESIMSEKILQVEPPGVSLYDLAKRSNPGNQEYIEKIKEPLTGYGNNYPKDNFHHRMGKIKKQ